MKRGRLPVLAAVAGACVLGVVLWRFWTPRCNEGCPSWIAMAMIAWVAALPIVAAVAAGSWLRRRRATVPTVLVVLMAASAVWLTLAAG